MERELETRLIHGEPPNVLVIGDVMVDQHVHCDVLGLSPEDDLTPKVKVIRRAYSLGGAANVAMNLRKLGAVTTLIGMVGDDEPARLLREKLSSNEIQHYFHVDSRRPTTLKTRYLTPRGRHIIRVDSEIADVDDRFLPWLQKTVCLPDVDAVVVSDYAKGVISRPVMNLLREQLGGLLIVDPKQKLQEYGEVFAVTPNQREFDQFINMENFNLAKWVVITKGQQGCTLWNSRGIREGTSGITFPVRKREMGDPTGCGDSFVAAFTFAITRGLRPEVACRVGNAAGSVKFDHHGTYAVSIKKIVDEVYASEENK